MYNKKYRKIYQAGVASMACLAIGTAFITVQDIIPVYAASANAEDPGTALNHVIRIYEITSTDGKIHDRIVDQFNLHKQKDSQGDMIWVNEKGEDSWPVRPFNHYEGYTPSSLRSDADYFSTRPGTAFVVKHIFLYPGERSSDTYMRLSANLDLVDKKGKVIQTHIYTFMFPKGSSPQYKVNVRPEGNWKLEHGSPAELTFKYGKYGFQDEKLPVEPADFVSDETSHSQQDSQKQTESTDSNAACKDSQDPKQAVDKDQAGLAHIDRDEQTSNEQQDTVGSDVKNHQSRGHAGQTTDSKSASETGTVVNSKQDTPTADPKPSVSDQGTDQTPSQDAPMTDPQPSVGDQGTDGKPSQDTPTTASQPAQVDSGTGETPSQDVPVTDPKSDSEEKPGQTTSTSAGKTGVDENNKTNADSGEHKADQKESPAKEDASHVNDQQTRTIQRGSATASEKSDPAVDRALLQWENDKQFAKETGANDKLPQTGNQGSQAAISLFAIISSLMSLAFVKCKKLI